MYWYILESLLRLLMLQYIFVIASFVMVNKCIYKSNMINSGVHLNDQHINHQITLINARNLMSDLFRHRSIVLKSMTHAAYFLSKVFNRKTHFFLQVILSLVVK